MTPPKKGTHPTMQTAPLVLDPHQAPTNGREATDAKMLAKVQRLARVAALRANGWKVELSGGQSATLRDPDRFPERLAKAIKVAMVRSTPDGETLNAEATIDSGYVVVAAFVESWTLGVSPPTPADVDALLDLSSRDFSVLATAASDLREQAFEDYSPSPEPSSPFDSSSG